MKNSEIIWDLINKPNITKITLSFSFLGYIDEKHNIVEINYQDTGITHNELLLILKNLEQQGKIKIIDTQNMGYEIEII